VKCLVDHQLPPALARFLTARGVESWHVTDFGLAETEDARIWEFAVGGDYVLISKDQDFLNFALKSKSTRLIWVRLGNCRKTALLQRL